MKETANAGALAGLEGLEPKTAVASAAAPAVPTPAVKPAEQPAAAPATPEVNMQAIIDGVRKALQAEGNAEIDALKRQIAEKDKQLEDMRRQKEEAQLVDRHRTGANESHPSSKARWGIVIDEARDPNEIDPVVVQVNGRAYSIKRGMYVEVPREVVSVLGDAVQTITTPVKDGNGNPTGQVIKRNARRFPFQNHGKMIETDGKRLKDAPSVEATDIG